MDTTVELFLDHWYDEVTLNQIASAAGVAPQTVFNQFGTKEGVLIAILEQPVPERFMTRAKARPDDIADAVGRLVSDYEFAGDAILRSLALEGRIPALQPFLDRGRQEHRDWLCAAFPAVLAAKRGKARERCLDLLVCATDLFTWKLLRRDRKLSRAQTADAMAELVEGIHR